MTVMNLGTKKLHHQRRRNVADRNIRIAMKPIQVPNKKYPNEKDSVKNNPSLRTLLKSLQKCVKRWKVMRLSWRKAHED